MVIFKGGLFCAQGWGTRMGLEDFQAYLALHDVQLAKDVMAERLRASSTERAFMARRIVNAIGFFQRCAREPRGFHRDPLFLDRCVLDLRDWTRRFPRRTEWSELHDTFDALAKLAERTKTERLAMLMPGAAPTRALPN